MIAANLWLDQSVIALQSDHNVRPPFVGVFIAGMMCSYIYHGLLLQKDIINLRSGLLVTSLSLAGLALLATYILLGTDILFNPGYYPSLKFHGLFGIAAGVMILLALTTPGTLYSRFLSLFPLRAMGLVGYSFYLLHPPIITLVLAIESYYLGYNIGTWTRFAIVFLMTYLLSSITYTYIERPFLGRNK